MRDRKFLIYLILVMTYSCREIGDPTPELLKGVTPLIAIPNPVAIEMPNEGEELFSHVTFHTAVPSTLGGAIGRPFVDKLFLRGIRGKVSPIAGNLQEHSNIRVIILQGRAAIPSKKLSFDTLGEGDQLLRYGITFFVIDGPRQNVLGDFWLTDSPTSEKLSWQNPEISIISPGVDEIVSGRQPIRLAAELVEKNNEPVRISWFVSSGSVENRRALETIWSDYEAGPQTVFVTVRGLHSRAAAIAAQDIVVE